MSGPNWVPAWLLDPLAPPPDSGVSQIISGGKVVSGGYRNPFVDPLAIQAERLLLRTVVQALKDHPAVWMWNLGNEPDLFGWPAGSAAGRAWVRDMTGLIKSIDPLHSVTCGLHSANLHQDNGLRVDHVFAETDVAVMHFYPMYTPWVRHPLDPNVVPYTCALVSALSGKPTLMEEWGGCTTAPGEPSQVWSWTGYGRPQKRFMASEEDMAAYVQNVLPHLIEVGATGALLWCFADYIPELWDRPPCLDSRHERFFGLVRPDGSLKPHAQVIKDFAATRPTVQPARRRVDLDITPDEYYDSPVHHVIRLYFKYLDQHGLW
jgi:endo-1,4-beta-mannosidase